MIDPEISAADRTDLPIWMAWPLSDAEVFNPGATVHQHQVGRMINDESGVVTVAANHDFRTYAKTTLGVARSLKKL